MTYKQRVLKMLFTWQIILTCNCNCSLFLLETYFIICVASLQKGPHVAKIKKIKISLDLNRAGHDESVKKKLAF